MRTKKGFMLRTVANRNIVISIGKASLEFRALRREINLHRIKM